ncbi:alpha-amylase family glycosyl hydrolase [Psychrobacillus psychrodurans]|uniref:Alpha-amylase family glycosyl hydrolase n=1 Tax=Psychrobacillus psychrodurans TaxID=126157 RepID=A0A9X3L5X2_9BACI|nr:alpha-amylase family glycosyl hydrolase [Psychrobacillus psychrodurans]MCZ8531747.1 alpha-amylase family glycosyl hydrolase [Psychrobacillus psychrodurans]
MKLTKWIITGLLMSSLCLTTSQVSNAETNNSIHNESIYDLYVDRYFNKLGTNDYNVNPKDPNAFAGGDFLGVMEKMAHIKDMGFTTISIGPVFATESYDGKRILNFDELEKQFGTPEEFNELLDKSHEQDLKIMVEFPLNNYSENHTWATDNKKSNWILSKENGQTHLDLTNPEVQQALTETIVNFAETYKIDGIKLSELDGAPTSFINDLIAAVKEIRDPMYVIALEESEADFDIEYSEKLMLGFRDTFKNTDRPSESISLANENNLLMVDHLLAERITYHSALENMFPPTRIKMAIGTILTLPGVPYMTYGTEIAMNGQNAQDSHQIMNFRVDEELIEYLKDMASIRTKSETMRTGKMKLLENKDGYAVYKRYSNEETFIVIINNTSETKRIDISSEEIGEDKELRGLFESDTVRASDDGSYRLVLDREIAEVYQVKEDKGLNSAYIAAMIIAYLLFMLFLIIVWKKGKQRRMDEENK